MPHRPPRRTSHEPTVAADNFVSNATDELPAPSPETPDVPPLPGPRDVPYIPTDQHVVNKMLEMARVTHGDVLYDLGCGDGRICITAAKLGARAVGVEIDLARLRDCHDNLRNSQLHHRVEFRRQSFFDVDLRPATVVALYLLPAINRKLRPKLLHELRPGTRIVANYFEIADWTPDEQIVFKHRPVMLWIVPAWVEGTWRCAFRQTAPARREFHVELELRRVFQNLTGAAHWRTRTHPRHSVLREGRVRGYDLALTLPDLPETPGPVALTATYDTGDSRHTTATLRGHYRSPKCSGVFTAYRARDTRSFAMPH